MTLDKLKKGSKILINNVKNIIKDNKMIILVLLIIIVLVILIRRRTTYENFRLSDNEILSRGRFSSSSDISNAKLNKDYNTNVDESLGASIVSISNPSNVTNGIRQENNGGKYRIEVSLEGSKKYLVSYWLLDKTDDKLKSHEVELLYKVSGDLIRKKKLIPKTVERKKYNGEEWLKIESNFDLPENIISDIIINFVNNSKTGYRVIVDIRIQEIMSINLPLSSDIVDLYLSNFKVNNLSLDGLKLEGEIDNNYITWNTAPRLEKGYIKITSEKGSSSIKSNKIDNKNFTIVMRLKTNAKSGISDTIYIPGVNKDSTVLTPFIGLNVLVNNTYGPLTVIYNNKELDIKKDIITNDFFTLSIIRSNNKLTVYVDKFKAYQDENIENVEFSNGNYIINNQQNSNYLLNYLILYNRDLDDEQLFNVHQFMEDQNKLTDDIKIEVPVLSEYTKDGKTDITVRNIGGKCLSECQNMCSLPAGTSLGNINGLNEITVNYPECVKNCATILDSCKDFCVNRSDGLCEYKDREFAKQFKIDRVEDMVLDSKKLEKYENRNSDCPEIYYKDGQYYTYIKKNSRWAKDLGRHGEISYGENRKIAKDIYLLNFPSCKVPEIIDDHGINPHNKNCPFIVREGNPCRSVQCRDIDWSKDPLNCNMSRNCRKTVNNYCELNSELDSACYCWREENRDKEHCKKILKHFRDTDSCDIRAFEIEEHPDFNKYIRKDKIPCWNCSVN
jgi:hypothetical protein